MNNYNGYYDWYQNYNFYRPMRNSLPQESLFSPKEGFEKGNMFSNLYSQYKNYQPMKLNPETEQEKILFDLQALCFAAHELNLYLDIHPEDQSMLTLFRDYCGKVRELTKNYENKYGPLTTNSKEMQTNTFEWSTSPWPWEEYNV